jgi:chromosome segregation ATPase
MPVDVGAVTLKLKAGEETLKKYDATAKDLDDKMKRKMAEFQLINQGLWQGKDHIKELEAKVAAAQAEVATAKDTFNKMVTNKIGPIKKELSNMGQTASNTAVMTKTLETQVKALHTELDKATGDKLKLAAAYTQVKKLETDTGRVYMKLNDMKMEIAGLPATPAA